MLVHKAGACAADHNSALGSLHLMSQVGVVVPLRLADRRPNARKLVSEQADNGRSFSDLPEQDLPEEAFLELSPRAWFAFQSTDQPIVEFAAFANSDKFLYVCCTAG